MAGTDTSWLMGKISHNEMTKQNATSAIFPPRERTGETEEGLCKGYSRELHRDECMSVCHSRAILSKDIQL